MTNVPAAKGKSATRGESPIVGSGQLAADAESSTPGGGPPVSCRFVICHLLFVIASARGILPLRLPKTHYGHLSSLFVRWVARFCISWFFSGSESVAFCSHQAVCSGSNRCREGTGERKIGKENHAYANA